MTLSYEKTVYRVLYFDKSFGKFVKIKLFGHCNANVYEKKTRTPRPTPIGLKDPLIFFIAQWVLILS